MQTITIAIDDRSQTLSATELADFLYFFRATNLALRDIVPRQDHNLLRQPTHLEISDYRSRMAKYSISKLNSFFEPQNSPDFFQITQINRQSPMEMTVTGCIFCLV